MWREVFGFNRAETFALVLLLMLFAFGGGVYLYQKSSETIPAAMIFEPIVQPGTAVSRAEANAAVADTHRRSRLRINLNTAPADSLQLLPHIGPVLSERIVAYRVNVAGFDSVGQLVEVKGIGAKRLAQLRPYLTAD